MQTEDYSWGVCCKNIQCDIDTHRRMIDNAYICLNDVLIESAHAVFPKCRPRKQSIPYWSKEIKPLKTDSIFWHWMWSECGKPTQGVVRDIYLSCKRKYHYAVRQIKKHEESFRRARMAECIANNRSRDLWKELKKMKPASKVVPPNIDGETDPKTICDNFAGKYSALYNSVPYDGETMAQIKSRLSEKIDAHMTDYKITTDKINSAIKMLKTGKSDGSKGLWSDMVIHSPEKWRALLANLISLMFTHGYYAYELRKATICPVPKDTQGNLCCSDNFRGIALSSAVNKVIDWIILKDNKSALSTSHLQFAFKEKSSTTMCTLALREVAAYYQEKGGKVLCTLLDASKAFDRLRYDKLFEILESRDLHPLTLRLLINLYEGQLTCARWLHENSDYFSSVNGIRQGGVASPILFTVYMDALIKRLEASQVGCYVGREYYGILCYADDVTLLAPTGSALQELLDICETFGKEYDVVYNSKKSICVAIGRRLTEAPKVMLNGKMLEWRSAAQHLGHVVNQLNDDRDDIKSKKSDFIAKANSVTIHFNQAQIGARRQVFTSRCCSFYGSQLWSLDSKPLNELFVTWRKATRRLLNVPWKTRSSLLPLLMDCKPLSHQFCIRFLRLIKSIIKGDNAKLQWLLTNCASSGNIFKNIEFICRGWNVTREAILSCTAVNLKPQEAAPEMSQRAQAILEFLTMDNDHEEHENIKDIVEFLCIN